MNLASLCKRDRAADGRARDLHPAAPVLPHGTPALHP